MPKDYGKSNALKYGKIKRNKEAGRSTNITNTINYVIDYAMDNKKKGTKCIDPISNEKLITYLNCDSDDRISIIQEFSNDEKVYHSHKKEGLGYIDKEHKIKKKPNEAIHIFLSFNGKRVPAKKVHEIGVLFARRLCGGDYRVVVTTHTNTANYHDHIVVNAYHKNGWQKFPDLWNLVFRLRDISNQIALENGLDILVDTGSDEKMEPDENIDFEKKTIFNVYSKKETNKLLKEILAENIKKAREKTRSVEEYIKLLKKWGCETKFNYTKDDKEKISSITYIISKVDEKDPEKTITLKIRGEKLGREYSYRNLLRYFEEKSAKKGKKTKKTSFFHNNEHINGINIKELIPSEYIGTRGFMTRVPFLIRLIKFFINVLKALLKAIEGMKLLDKIKYDYKKEKKEISEKIKECEEVKELIEKYKIDNIYKLKDSYALLQKEYAITNNKINRLKTIGRTQKKLIDAYDIVKKSKDKIKEMGVFDDMFFDTVEYKDSNKKEFLARLNPTKMETKGRLSSLLDKKGLALSIDYNQLSEAEAIKLYATLKENKIDSQYIIKKGDKKDSQEKNIAYANLLNSKKNKYKGFSKEQTELLKKYQKSMTLLKAYGLLEEKDISNIISENEKRINDVDRLVKLQEERKTKIKELGQIQDVLEYKVMDFIKNLTKNDELYAEIISAKNDIKKSRYEMYNYIESIVNTEEVKGYIENDEIIGMPKSVEAIINIKNEVCGEKDKNIYEYSKDIVIEEYINFFRRADFKEIERELDGKRNETKLFGKWEFERDRENDKEVEEMKKEGAISKEIKKKWEQEIQQREQNNDTNTLKRKENNGRGM